MKNELYVIIYFLSSLIILSNERFTDFLTGSQVLQKFNLKKTNEKTSKEYEKGNNYNDQSYF